MHRKTEETKRVVLEAMGAGGGREKEILRRGERDGGVGKTWGVERKRGGDGARETGEGGKKKD